MTHNLIFEKIPLAEVLECDRIKFNSNNHWKDNIPPIDYNKRLEDTYTHNWIDKFHSKYHRILINNIYCISFLKNGNRLFQMGVEVTNLFSDEIEHVAGLFNNEYPHIFANNNSYFVRSENVSLKKGIHGVGPYKDFKSIIESIITCNHGHSPFDCIVDNTLVIYLLPWKEDIKDEFRIFVYKNRITAISQQQLYKQIYTDADEERLKNMCNIIIEAFYNETQGKLSYMESYVYDVAVIDGNAYFIEPNPFGEQYSSGSALFHWILDSDKLYNDENNIIYIRTTS